MAQVNLTPLGSLVDEVWGREGTPKRDEMETRLKAEVNAQLRVFKALGVASGALDLGSEGKVQLW